MIVIAGCGRSGTSLLLSVLSCHPDLTAIPHETRALADTPLRLEELPHQGRWVEKTPINVLNLPRILRALPDAKVIHLVRDGRDVITSHHPKVEGQYVTTARWVRDVSAGARSEDHPRVTVVRYRDLVQDYEPTLRNLCDFLDITWTERFIDYPNTATVQTHAAWDGPARAIDAASVDRWKRPEFSKLVSAFMQTKQAVRLLERYGFETNH